MNAQMVTIGNLLAVLIIMIGLLIAISVVPLSAMVVGMLVMTIGAAIFLT